MEQIKDEDLMYVWFDFHGECKKMKYENLSKLIDLIKDKMQSYNFFQASLDQGFDSRDKFTKLTCKIE